MPFILRHYNLFQVPLDDIYVGLWYIMLCVQNRRWYSKQVHFYSVFLSICYIAQNQCVSFHKVLQWFIFLQGLRVSKHTVFPVCKFKNQFTQVASSLLRSMWRWRRSFKCWVFFISSGRLLSLTNECLSWLHLLFLTVRAMSTTQIACYDYIDPHKLCSFVLKTHTELLFDRIEQGDTTNIKARLGHPHPLLQRYQPSEDGRQCLLLLSSSRNDRTIANV